MDDFYSLHPRALVVKRMMSGVIQLIQTKKRTCYVPVGSGQLVERKKRISPSVLRRLVREVRECFWLVYRFDRETLLAAQLAWSDADLATLWGAWREGQYVWPMPLLRRANANVGEDWKEFCLIEQIA